MQKKLEKSEFHTWLWNFVLIVFLAGCASQGYEPLITIEPFPAKVSKNSSPAQQQAKLMQVTDGRPQASRASVDISAALNALKAESESDWETAAKQWLSVLENDKASMASYAFPRWIKAQEHLVDKPVQADLLARLLWAETREGQTAPWLSLQGWTNISVLTERIKDLQNPRSGPEVKLASSPREIVDDPFWEKASLQACKVELPDQWRVWVKSLNPSQRSYWDGLQSCCRGDYQSAVPAFERALPTLRLKPSTWPLALNAANRLVAARKSLGQRPETTEAYRLLANLLAQPESLSAATGWSAFEVWRRRAEAWFWVARSEALQGDYQNGKISVHQGLTQVKTAQTSLPNLSDKQQQIYDDLRADGYHILASRIAYEEKDYVGALSLNRLAQDISGLSLEWRQRLQWAEAWYLYVSNDRYRAVQVWENLLTSSKDEAKPRLHYWIGRALLELGKKTQAEDVFQSLTHDYPLSFYTVVALPKLDKNFIFKDRWVDVSRLEKRLQTRQNLVLESFQKDLEAERRLVRLELCLAAGLDQWLEPLAAELYRYVSTRPLLLKEVQTSLYVSRLLHMSGAHLLAISLTTQLSNQLDNFWDIYPEQILVYFPQPFLDVYQRTAASNYIDIEIPLAISRQESSFQSNAESPAEALGLMQLMTATAHKQAERLGVPLRNPAEELKQPSINIGLGTAYLSELGRRYQAQWPQAFAAYNAGEYAVDAWLKRRASLDLVLWTEALSFGETSSYVKNVWRNWEVYRWLRQPNSH